ncbi:MAG TPA: 50S ribosomal protein L25 [Acidimicrobiia bacterium]
MAEQITLRAEAGRATGSRESRRVRRTGAVPAIVYGKDMDPIPVAVDHHDLVAALSTEAGRNALINLAIGADTLLTMPKVVERHPFRNLIRHVDFVTVSLTEVTQAEVAVHFLGEALGVKDGGILSTPRTSVLIEALPTGIPNAIEVDISGLELGDTLRIADLPAMEGVSYLDDLDQLVASITAPAAEIVEEEPELEEGEAAEEEAAEAEAGEAGESAGEGGE